MFDNIHSPYAHTASYFVFKSIITIISSFVSISILTIHWIEHNNNKFNDLPCNSLTTTPIMLPKRKKLKKYTLSKRIILRLTWSIIIIFCMLCVLHALLTIIEQVATLNEVKNILCTKWTLRILASAFQFGIGLMHCLFMAQLYEIYNNTDFAYLASTLRIFSLIVLNLTVLSTVLVLLFLDVDPIEVQWLGRTHNTCITVKPQFLNIIVGGSELFIVLSIIYLYIHPMNKMISLHKSSLNDVEYPSILIFKIHKTTTLALIASISTFISTMIIGWTYAIWPSFMVMPLNCICIMFMTSYYPNGYKKICCLFTKLQVRLFKKANKQKLRSELVYHASNQSSVVDLKGIQSKDEIHKKQKETEAYLGVHDRLALSDHGSYDPYGGGRQSLPATLTTDERKINTSSALEIASKNSKHKIANTTEMMIMDIKPLNVAIQSKSQSSKSSSTNNYKLNETMLSRTDYDQRNKKQQLMENNSSNQLLISSSDDDIDNLMNNQTSNEFSTPL